MFWKKKKEKLEINKDVFDRINTNAPDIGADISNSMDSNIQLNPNIGLENNKFTLKGVFAKFRKKF